MKKAGILTVLNANSGKVAAHAATMSVLSPCAQNTSLCGDLATGVERCFELDSCLAKLACEGKRVCIIFYLQMVYGLRISEVLGIRPYDITSGGFIKIVGSKGSSSRLVACTLYADFFKQCKLSGTHPFNMYNRFVIYRLYKKHGISHKFAGNEKSSVTHLPRHLLALQANQVEDETGIVTDALRHKSTKNKSFYVKEK